MANWLPANGPLRDALLARLLESPLDYRHALGILDPQYQEWRAEGKPEHELVFVNDVPLLMVKSDGVCLVLGEPDDAGARAIVGFLSHRDINELHLLGQTEFRALKPYLASGQWRCSRNYGVTAAAFRPRPSACVRKLGPEDRDIFERACATLEGFRESRSMARDSDLMAKGFAVSCYGAFAGENLVGFCSANPMCRGVTEISSLEVASQHRRRGMASAMLTAHAQEAFARGEAVGYHAGSAGDDLDAMLLKLGFRELKASYRFIPSSSPDQWRTIWGRPV